MSDTEASEHGRGIAAKKKKPVKKTPTKKTPAEVPTPAKVPPIKKAWLKAPTISWEKSRGQVMCRSGQGGPGSSVRFAFAEHGGEAKAWNKAKAWHKDALEKYNSRRKVK